MSEFKPLSWNEIVRESGKIYLQIGAAVLTFSAIFFGLSFIPGGFGSIFGLLSAVMAVPMAIVMLLGFLLLGKITFPLYRVFWQKPDSDWEIKSPGGDDYWNIALYVLITMMIGMFGGLVGFGLLPSLVGAMSLGTGIGMFVNAVMAAIAFFGMAAFGNVLLALPYAGFVAIRSVARAFTPDTGKASVIARSIKHHVNNIGSGEKAVEHSEAS